MAIRNALISLALFCAVGCGSARPPLMDSPINVTGRVADPAGKPVTNVALNLQPLEHGYLKTIQLEPNGEFKVETQPGKYAYYFTPKAGARSVPAQVAQATQASMDRVVVVADGQSLDIQLP